MLIYTSGLEKTINYKELGMKKACILGMAILLTGLFAVACETNPNEIADEITGDYWMRVYNPNDCCTPPITNVPADVRSHNSNRSWPVWNNEARPHFLTADGRWTDDFGGVFIDGSGIVNISVVGNRRPVRSDYLIYRQVHNSYNFLNSIKDGVAGIMREENVAWGVAVHHRCNRVSIRVGNEKEIYSLIEHLRARNLFKRNTLRIWVGPPPILL